MAKISAIIETVAKKRKYKDRNQKRSFFLWLSLDNGPIKKKGRDNVHRQYFFSLGPIVEIAVHKLYKKNVPIGRFVQRVSYF